MEGNVMTAFWRTPAGLHVASARLPDEGELPSLDGAAGRPRSGGPARLATWWTAYCSWSHRPTSPGRSCTSTAAKSPATDIKRVELGREPGDGSQLRTGHQAVVHRHGHRAHEGLRRFAG